MWCLRLQDEDKIKEIHFNTLRCANFWYMRFKTKYNWYDSISLKHYAK